MSQMNVPLTGHEVGASLDPAPHLPPAGDWHDDDGRAIDDYLNTSDPTAPASYVAVPLPREELPTPQRILRARYVLTSPGQGGSPQSVRAFPTDLKRTKLKITELTNKGFYFHSENFTVVDTPTTAGAVAQTAAFFMSGTGAPGIPTGPILELDNYTGPIYIGPCFDTGAANTPVVIEILCVTC